jgi:ubiquinone/menaquinone biosynthesis C-methylase UbiE
MSDKQAIIEAFTDLAPRYEQVVDSELKRFWGWSYDGFIENLIAMTPMVEDDIILDVATGTSVIPLKLTSRGKKHGQIIGLDITLAMLRKGQQKIAALEEQPCIFLTCGSAMAMPFKDGYFDVIVCGLASHHLDVPLVLAEMRRILKAGGRLTIADVGGSPVWRLPVISGLIRLGTFLYFLPKEGFARARSEAGALSNVLTGKEWERKLFEFGFQKIDVTQLPKSHFWAPAPLVMRAQKAISS